MGGGKGRKKEFQGAKVLPEATKDISKCFLQNNIYFPVSPWTGPVGLLRFSS